jgi:phage gp29-like protein
MLRSAQRFLRRAAQAWQQLAAAPERPVYRPGLERVQAALTLIHYLISQPDIDVALKKAGISRHQLSALESDDEVFQAMETRRDALVATPWRLEPNQTRAAKFLTEALRPWLPALLAGAFKARSYGYSVQQVNYRQDADNRIRIQNLWVCPMQWFTPTFTGDLLAREPLYIQDGTHQIPLAQSNESVLAKYPEMYLLTVCNGSYEQPYGEALLSRLYFPVTWRREGWALWLDFLANFGEPLIVGQTLDYNAFVEAMHAQGLKSVVGFQADPGSDTKIQSIMHSQPGEFERLENALISRIQRLYLGQNLTSKVEGGSFAAANVHNLVRLDKRNADVRMVSQTVQYLVNVLARLNGMDPPKFVMADETGLEAQRAERDATLVPVLSASQLRLAKGYFTDRYDYVDEDLEPVEPIEPAAEMAEAARMSPVTMRLAAGDATLSPTLQAVEDLVMAAQTQAGLPIPETALLTAIRAARDPDDLRRRLQALLNWQTADRSFETILSQADFAARVLGYVAAEERQ